MAGKYIAQKKRHFTPFVVVLAVAALVATIGGTMAWLTTNTAGLTNIFTPANVYIEVVEDFSDPTVKKDVYIANGTKKNPSEADVYIRATIVANWQDSNGNVLAEPAEEGEDKDYTLTLSSTGWTKQGDYYYCTGVNTADGKENCTAVLIEKCVQNHTKAGYNLVVTVLAQAIQAEPADAVTDSWGASIPTGLAKIPAGN